MSTLAAAGSLPARAGEQWMTRRFGVRLVDSGAAQVPLEHLVGVALRRNPRRAHLLVSSVLGKHVPAAPRTVHQTGRTLGALAAASLPPAARPVVLGYAETATALGHCVAEQMHAGYLHSTRRVVAGVDSVAAFEEEHSHATRHLLLPEDPDLLAGPQPLVLVDDELSTGRTALNTVRALHARWPRGHYVIAALVDLRGPEARERLADTAREIGARIDAVSLGAGTIRWPEQFPQQAQRFVTERRAPQAVTGQEPAAEVRSGPRWPRQVRDGGRHGYTDDHVSAARTAAASVAAGLLPALRGERVLVLGFEELMYTPLLIALALSQTTDVRFSATTRSPVLPIDEPGYPIRTELRFGAHDEPADGPGERFAYNVAPCAGGARYTDIVLVVDDVADTPALHAADGLLGRLAAVCARVHLVRVPSYRPRA